MNTDSHTVRWHSMALRYSRHIIVHQCPSKGSVINEYHHVWYNPCMLRVDTVSNLGIQWGVECRQWTLLCVHSTVGTAVCPVYSGHCCVSTLQWALLCVHSTVGTAVCPLYSGHCCVSTLKWALLCVHFTVGTAVCPL